MRILAVADEVDERLRIGALGAMAPDLIVSCGDVPFELLGLLAESCANPVVFVPGNHDPDVSGYRATRAGLVVRSGFVVAAPWPAGTVNTDGRLTDVDGITIAGLGGCRRYRDGPNQYTERQQSRRARRLVRRQRWHPRRPGRGRPPVDVVLTHAAPRGMGDGDDRAHRGFDAHVRLVRALRPRLLLHGHVAPAPGAGDRWIDDTRVVNVFNHRLIELDRFAAPGEDR